MRLFWSLSLRRQLTIGAALLLVPLLVTAVWSRVVVLRERSTELADETRALAFSAAAYVTRDLWNLDGAAQGLESSPEAQAMIPGPVEELLRRLTRGHPMLARIDLISSSRHVVARVMSSTSQAFDESPDDWVEDVLGTGRPARSSLHIAPSGVRYVVFGYPVHDRSDRLVGAVGFFVNLKSLQESLSRFPIPESSVVTVADRDGRVLARSDAADEYVARLLPVDLRPTKQPRAPAEHTGIDGVRRMYGEAVVEGGPWTVIVGMPMTLALGQAASLWLQCITVLVFGIACWLIIAFGVSRRFVTSLGHLEAAARRIALGNFAPVEPRTMPTRELTRLQNAFDSMLRRFNDTRRRHDGQMVEERRMREEVQSLQRQVIRQERLAAVGQLVSGVAHEINNPLQAILGFSELLQMQGDVPQFVKTDLRLIQKESARACNIIRNLAMFARQTPGEAGPVLLADVIAAVLELRQRRLESEDIELRVDDLSSQHVSAVLTELQQVVLNFVVNAEQSILASGRLPGCITIRALDQGGRVILEVEDTGPGIPPDDEPRLFQPFFTTKPVGQGTGLGLSISYGIIDSLGGSIGHRNAPAGGAIFYFDLPALAAEPA